MVGINYLFATLLCIGLSVTNSYNCAQKLNFKEKRDWRKNLRKMNKDDEIYRIKMVKNPMYNNDSIWKLQSINDSINKLKFITLTEKYGFPSNKRIKYVNTLGLLLHFTLEKDFNELLALFEKEYNNGNMPAFDFAIWYDRCMVNMKKDNKFGAYGKKLFCGEELEKINLNRKNIGLPPLNPSPDCK